MITFNTQQEFENAVRMYLLNNMKIQFEQTQTNSGDKLLSVVLTLGVFCCQYGYLVHRDIITPNITNATPCRSDYLYEVVRQGGLNK